MKKFFTLFLLCIIALSAYSQTGKSFVIGTMTTKPNAVLVLNPQDGNQGFLLPQVTSANRLQMAPSSPSEDGLLVYDITDKEFYYWKNSQWNKGLGTNQTLTYDQLTQKLSIAGGNTIDLASLKEIPSQAGQAGKYITTDGTTLSWANLASIGDITSIVTGKGLTGGVTSGDATLSVKVDNATISFNGSDELQLANNAVTTSKIAPGSASSVLVTDAGGVVKWQTGSISDNQNLSLAGNTLNITNGTSVNLDGITAGGQVGGTINNLIIAPNTITSPMIQDGMIQGNDIGALAITGANIANATIPSSKLSASGVTSGTYGSATNVAQFTVDAQGRVTSAGNVTITGAAPTGSAGGDLAGNFPAPTIATGAGNNIVGAINNPSTSVVINPTRLSSSVVLDNEVLPAGDIAGTFATGLQINANAVTTSEILNSAVTDAKIAAGITISKLVASATNGQVLTTVAGVTTWSNLPSLSSTGVGAGTYGSSNQVAQITVDAQGRITNAVSTLITGVTPGGTAGGDLAGSYPTPTIASSAGNNIGTAINTSASAGSINGSKVNPNFGSQNITTSGNITSSGTGALSVGGASTLNGTLGVTGAATFSTLSGGTNMVVAGPTGLLGIQPIPATIVKGDLTTSTTGVTVTGGTNAVIGSGSTINIQNATLSQPGLLTAADFTTFNSKVGIATNPAAGDISGSFSAGFQLAGGSVGNTEVSSIATSKLQQSGATSGQLLVWNGSAWAPANPSVDGTTIAGSGVGIDPFRVKGGAANQILITNGALNVQWVNQSLLEGNLSLTGDVTGAMNANTVTKIRGVNVSSTAPTDQQVLQYDNATSRWRPATVASISPTAFKMRQTSQQTINGTEMLTWDDEQYDDGGNNFFSDTFHTPSSGLYHFDAIVTFLNVDKADDVEVMIRVNGADVHRSYGNTGQNDSNVAVSTSTDIKLNAGDLVTLWAVTQNNRQTMGSAVRTQFSGRKVY